MKESADILLALHNGLEKLKKELTELRAFHQAAWKEYGSKLCVGEMRNKEKELECRILALVQMSKWAEDRSADESLMRVVLSKIDRAIENKQMLLDYLKESLEADMGRRTMYKTIMTIAGIGDEVESGHAPPVNNG